MLILQKINFVGLIVLFCLVLSNYSFGQKYESIFTKSGNVEMGGSLYYQSDNVSGNGHTQTNTTIIVQPNVGFFVSYGFELGFNLGFASMNSGNSTVLTFMFAPSYNIFTHSSTYPFIEGQLGYASMNSGSTTLSGLAYGLRGGIKEELTSHVLMNITLQYQNLSLSYSGSSSLSIDKMTETILTIGLGLTVWLD